MNKEEIKKYLKENLEVIVIYDKFWSSITVTIKLEGEEITRGHDEDLSNKEQNMKKLYNAIKSSKDWKIVRINGKLYVKRRKTQKEQ